jgi:hypothetical protein
MPNLTNVGAGRERSVVRAVIERNDCTIPSLGWRRGRPLN